MAGWSSKDREVIEWDGTIIGKQLRIKGHSDFDDELTINLPASNGTQKTPFNAWSNTPTTSFFNFGFSPTDSRITLVTSDTSAEIRHSNDTDTNFAHKFRYAINTTSTSTSKEHIFEIDDVDLLQIGETLITSNIGWVVHGDIRFSDSANNGFLLDYNVAGGFSEYAVIPETTGGSEALRIISNTNNGAHGYPIRMFLEDETGGIRVESGGVVIDAGDYFYAQQNNMVSYQNHAASTPTRALNTTYQNNLGHPIIVYGSVACQWVDDAATVAYIQCKTDSSSPPTSVKMQAGTTAAVFIVTSNLGCIQSFPFYFVVQPSHYYRIDSTVSGTLGAVSLEYWNEVNF